MPTLLKIDVSPRGDNSISRQLSKQFTEQWGQNHPDGAVVTRDLAKIQIPFIDLPWIAGAYAPPDQHTAEHKAALKISDEFIAELLAADEVLISTPVYNFNIPAALKAWIDHIVRKGLTFTSGPGGFKGLVNGKKVTIIIASGGNYLAGTPTEAWNHQTPYLRFILGFIGITDITFIEAGGASEIIMGKISKEDFFAKVTPQVLAAAL